MLEKSPGFAPFGADVAVLDADKDNPGQAAVDQGHREGEQKNGQLIDLKPQHLEGAGQILGEFAG